MLFSRGSPTTQGSNMGLLHWQADSLPLSHQGSLLAETACQCRRRRRFRFDPPGGEVPLEKEMAAQSCILAWRMPWTEETGGLRSRGLQRVGYD